MVGGRCCCALAGGRPGGGLHASHAVCGHFLADDRQTFEIEFEISTICMYGGFAYVRFCTEDLIPPIQIRETQFQFPPKPSSCDGLPFFATWPDVRCQMWPWMPCGSDAADRMR